MVNKKNNRMMKSFRWILVLVLRWPLHTPSSEVARSVQKCEAANCWGAGCEDSWKPPESDCGGRNFSAEIFHKKVLGLLVYQRGCHNEGAAGTGPGTMSGVTVATLRSLIMLSSDSGSSKAIIEQMILQLLLHVTMHVNENKHGQLTIFW